MHSPKYIPDTINLCSKEDNDNKEEKKNNKKTKEPKQSASEMIWFWGEEFLSKHNTKIKSIKYKY